MTAHLTTTPRPRVLSLAIAAGVAIVRERRAAADPLMAQEERLESVFLSAEARALPDDEREALRDALGLPDVKDELADVWHAWSTAVDDLVQIPARTIADVEAKFRAVADCNAPHEVDEAHFEQAHLAAIWTDLIRLSTPGFHD